jgi:hypothetical protein
MGEYPCAPTRSFARITKKEMNKDRLSQYGFHESEPPIFGSFNKKTIKKQTFAKSDIFIRNNKVKIRL